MKFDFDTVVNRKNTNAIKYDLAKKRGKPEDAVSLWVADMDFPTAPCIQKAVAEKASHGIWGYSRPDNRYYDALKNGIKSAIILKFRMNGLRILQEFVLLWLPQLRLLQKKAKAY